MKVIRILNAKQEKYPILRARWLVNKHGDAIVLKLFYVHIYIMKVNYAKSQKTFDWTILGELP